MADGYTDTDVELVIDAMVADYQATMSVTDADLDEYRVVARPLAIAVLSALAAAGRLLPAGRRSRVRTTRGGVMKCEMCGVEVTLWHPEYDLTRVPTHVDVEESIRRKGNHYPRVDVGRLLAADSVHGSAHTPAKIAPKESADG